MQTVYKLDHSGKILWRLGGKSNDFDIGPGAHFAWQHDVRRQPDGTLTIFDNGATPAVEKLSRGLILELDEQAITATLLRQYTHPKILSGSQGSMQLLGNGNVFVGWGEVPHVSEFDYAGRMLFDAVLGEKYQSYRAFRLPWTGLPAEAPAIAVAEHGRERTVYASWNGATDVDRWQLLAGTQAGALQPVSNTRSHGFETAPAHDHCRRALPRGAGPRRRRRTAGTVAHGRGIELRLSSRSDAFLRQAPTDAPATMSTRDDLDPSAFTDLSASELSEIAAFGTERPVAAGELLFQVGEASYDLFVVLEGEIEVVRVDGAEAVVIVAYGPGGFAGELNLLTGQRRSLSCRVTQSGRVLVVSEAEFRRLMGGRPELAETIFSALLARREVLRSGEGAQAIPHRRLEVLARGDEPAGIRRALASSARLDRCRGRRGSRRTTREHGARPTGHPGGDHRHGDPAPSVSRQYSRSTSG